MVQMSASQQGIVGSNPSTSNVEHIFFLNNLLITLDYPKMSPLFDNLSITCAMRHVESFHNIIIQCAMVGLHMSLK
jgi:hypothetical protein